MKSDLIASLTHANLRIETAADALAVMFLVECGVLPPAVTDGGISLELGCHLGHGNVLVFLDKNDRSTTLELHDRRRWQPPLRMRGLYIYRDCDESSKLCRMVLTARKNTIIDDCGMSWHLVAYLDCSTLAAELPTISSIRRFVQCVSLMPHGYFIPEFGRLAMDPPPPMQRVEWNAVAFSLPPMQSQQTEWTRDMLPASDIDVQNEARVLSTEFFQETAATRLANRSVEAIFTQRSVTPKSPGTTGPAKTIPEPPPDPASIITFPDFQRLVQQSPIFKLHLKRYKRLAALSGDVLLQDCLHDILSSIQSLTLRANNSSDNIAQPNVIFRRIVESGCDVQAPTSVLFECGTERDYDSYDWRHAILFFQCGGQDGTGPHATDFEQQAAASKSHTLGRRGSTKPAAELFSAFCTLQGPQDSSAQTGASSARIKELRLGLHRCASEILHFNPMRKSALGVAVSGMSAYFGYFDHAGAIFASPIHVEDDAGVFINAILSACSAGGRRYFTNPPCPDFVYNPVTLHSSRLFDHLNDTLTITGSISSPSEEDSRPFHLFSTRCVPKSGVGHTSPADAMLDVRWVPCSDAGATNMLDISRLTESRGIAHIARVHASATACKLSQCERAELGLSPSLDLVFRITLFSPPCVPLHVVSNQQHFKRAFVSLFKAHYETYRQIGLLHRDISPRNLMVSRDDPDYGVLNGFHSVSNTTAAQSPLKACAQAFLAVDLLRNDERPAVFWYRHDLESFLYVLAWMAYRPQDERTVHPLSGWWRQGYAASRDLKLQFLKGHFPPDDISSPIVPLHWITGIRGLFRNGYGTLEESGLDRGGSIGFDEETLRGHVTYERFLQIIST